MKYTYELTVEGDDERGYVARLDSVDSPLRGEGTTPLEAVRALCETVREWPITGADRWLRTNDGRALMREFVEDPFEPNRGKPRGETPS